MPTKTEMDTIKRTQNARKKKQREKEMEQRKKNDKTEQVKL